MPISSALRVEQAAKEKAAAAATEAQEEAEAVGKLLRQQAAEARENTTAVGQWLVTLGMEQEELKGQLAAAQSNRLVSSGSRFWNESVEYGLCVCVFCNNIKTTLFVCALCRGEKLLLRVVLCLVFPFLASMRSWILAAASTWV